MRPTLAAVSGPKAIVLTLTIAFALGCKKKPSTEAAAPSAAPNPAAVPTHTSSSEPTEPPATVSQQKYTTFNGRPLPDGFTYTGPKLQPAQEFKPYSGGPAPNIPFAKGLLTTAVIAGHLAGDLESLNTVVALDSKTATIEMDQSILPQSSVPAIQDKPNTGHSTRINDLADYASSNRIMLFAEINKTQHFPGSTWLASSGATLNLLKAGQPAQVQLEANENAKVAGLFSHHLLKLPTEVSWGDRTMFDCLLHRVEPGDLAVPVIVNDVPTDLPVVHARCVADSGEVEDLFILDQPSNPLYLATQEGPFAERMQVTKISYLPDSQETTVKPSGEANPAPGKSMEQKLANKEPVEVYGIYFDFNSAQIKPQSEATLKMISGILQKNPTWKLSLGGHTDNIGGDDFNLALSKKRAAAVKDALVSQYKIAPGRLSTDGFGATKPVAPNDTVQGRALNRRVELQRQ